MTADARMEPKGNDMAERNPKLPDGASYCNGEAVDREGSVIEVFEGRWRRVLDKSRDGWWRFNRHYDRSGYCDNPSRGY